MFHSAVKARGNPQCLQPLLNVTRFGPRGHVLWWARLLEKEERGRDGGGWRKGEKKGERKEVGSKGKVFKKIQYTSFSSWLSAGKGIKEKDPFEYWLTMSRQKNRISTSTVWSNDCITE